MVKINYILMEGSLKLVAYQFSPSTQFVMFVARLAGAPVVNENVNWGDPKRDELKSKTPTGTFPYLETSSGNISENNAIVSYLAETYRPELLGANTFDRASVRQWVEFSIHEIGRNTRALVYPLFGFSEYDKTAADTATKDIKEQMKLLNRHLQGRTFVVGSNMTLADASLYAAVRHLFQLVFVEDMRKTLFPNVTEWFNTISSHEHTIRSFGRTLLCKVPAKAPRVEKKEEPKKEVKKEEPKPKKEAVEGEESDEDKPRKKGNNPMDSLAPTTFVFDDFKKAFLNTKEKRAVLDDFWTKIDLNGFSFWFMQYQKLASEGKELFKSKNSAGMFLQKLDPFRKYTFSAHGVYGDEGNYEIRGVWMWRGTEIPMEVNYYFNFN